MQLIPALIARGYSGETAAAVLAVLGITQLPGRVFVLSGRSLPGVTWLLGVPLLLQAVGLLMLVIPAPVALATLGVATFGVGAGLNTLARPLAIQALYGTTGAGRFNGDLARATRGACLRARVLFQYLLVGRLRSDVWRHRGRIDRSVHRRALVATAGGRVLTVLTGPQSSCVTNDSPCVAMPTERANRHALLGLRMSGFRFRASGPARWRLRLCASEGVRYLPRAWSRQPACRTDRSRSSNFPLGSPPIHS